MYSFLVVERIVRQRWVVILINSLRRR